MFILIVYKIFLSSEGLGKLLEAINHAFVNKNFKILSSLDDFVWYNGTCSNVLDCLATF